MLNKVEVSSVLNEVIQIIEKGDGSINLVKMMIKGLKSIVDDDINEENAVKRLNEKDDGVKIDNCVTVDEPIVTSTNQILDNNVGEEIVNNNVENISESDDVGGPVIVPDTNNVQQNEDNECNVDASDSPGQEDVGDGNSSEDSVNDSNSVVDNSESDVSVNSQEDNNISDENQQKSNEVNNVQIDGDQQKIGVVTISNWGGSYSRGGWTGNTRSNISAVDAKLLGGTIVVN